LNDGIFAIAITLLALDLRVPLLAGEAPVPQLLAALAEQWPSYLAYVLSFVTILVMWLNHHTLFRLIRRTDHVLTLLNGLLLLVVTAMPFGTKLLAAYLLAAQSQVAEGIYASLQLLLALTYNLMLWYAVRHGGLFGSAVERDSVRALVRQYRFGPLLCAAAVGLAFVSTPASLGLCVVLNIFFALPSTLLHRVLSAAGRRAAP
jgi:uncharacterized membrane protein